MVLLIGYRLGPGRRIAAALSALRGPDRRINVGAAVAGALIVGISAQALIVVRGDGPAAAFEYASEQPTLSESFALFLLAGFATAGVLVWAAWRRPRGRLQWAAFISVVVAVCLFSVAAGSRGRVFVAVLALAVIVHYLWRPWRRREVAVAALLFVLFASSFLAFREVANESSVRAAAEEAPQHVLDPRVVLNDITSFDHVVYATTIYGRERGHEKGGFLLDGARSFVPRAIDSGKPDGGDIVFRRVVWGRRPLPGGPRRPSATCGSTSAFPAWRWGRC